MTEELKPELAPIEEKMTQELVKANVTEAVISTLRERYLPLKIASLEDKETYLLVKEGRKECKSLRVMAKKICTSGREEATAIQKAWIAKEKEVTGKIAEVEDYLEAQEKEYEAGIAAEKEARKRKQEEQLILRQQKLTAMGALYSDGNFTLGDVSFEFSSIKESEEDIWNETIYPRFHEEYLKIQAEELLKEQQRKEAEAELKRQQEEMERKRKELEEKEAELKREEERQAKERDNKEREKLRERIGALMALGFKSDSELCAWVGYGVGVEDSYIKNHTDDQWDSLIGSITKKVDEVKAAEAEEKRKEQERIDLQNKRYAELLPFDKFGEQVAMDRLWDFPKDAYLGVLEGKKAAFQEAEEERKKEIEEAAAKKERERIEEEQREAEVKRRQELRGRRKDALLQYNYIFTALEGDLADLTDTQWVNLVTEAKANHDEKIRKQEEERKAEELAQASDKVKWVDILNALNEIHIHEMRSGQYRKKAAILREKLEEIKAL